MVDLFPAPSLALEKVVDDWRSSTSPQIRVYKPLVGTPVFSEPLNREDALSKAHRLIWDRLSRRVANREDGGRIMNPVIATQAESGGGKSRFLDLVAAEVPAESKLGPEFRETWNHQTVKISLTYNDGTVIVREDQEFPESSFCVRLLSG
jgi:hypothetical protein